MRHPRKCKCQWRGAKNRPTMRAAIGCVSASGRRSRSFFFRRLKFFAAQGAVTHVCACVRLHEWRGDGKFFGARVGASRMESEICLSGDIRIPVG